MNVLVYFESVQQRVAQRTVALLAEKFAFDLDLLANFPPDNQDAWSKIVHGKVSVLRGRRGV